MVRSAIFVGIHVYLIVLGHGFLTGPYRVVPKGSHHQINTSPISAATSGEAVGMSNGGDFDSDFANMMSKPLPQWFIESEKKRERLQKEVQKNRERIIREFRAKYEVSAEEKEEERLAKLAAIEAKLAARKKKQPEQKGNWFSKAIGVGNKNREIEAELEEEEVSMSTKEKWEQFWKDEEEQTGFYLPGFFEVFPELKMKWPTWGRRKDGSAIECESDQDCPFPQACCPHPIIPGQRFCCTGFGRRIMVPAYARQEISGGMDDADDSSSGPGDDEIENWRPSPDISGF
mmetsp:Transcript_8020/g.13336  ORF Transcript_8020/g.13336 Transcript_8020/m.13336 type:complete len:288 (+) Transcript_8020:112-975(+)|eukprot:CAMPEP_0174961280 /NCGR_PEP_ID=MMETSP0004_2-20121128/4154_1 /TAXON_ID=420556 /ORGANISM="Ochromonas sp., Strain CCMP1393" /LENGTH=287 /DNA_ID=CAMNT_0016209711 /DNA_START=77 /DNA_END=940 /DNA_ORIENTATION=-